MEKTDPVSAVQSSEKEAKELLEKAVSSKSARLAKANDEAMRILERAEADSKKLFAEKIENTKEQISKGYRQALEDAKKRASKARAASLSKEKVHKSAKKIVREIIGA